MAEAAESKSQALFPMTALKILFPLMLVCQLESEKYFKSFLL